MRKELISKRTRLEFREWLVSWTLRTIEDLFEGHNIGHVPLPVEELPGGQRCSLVECYYASVDWTNADHVRRVLDAYEDILLEIPDECSQQKEKLIKYLERDGHAYVEGRITSDSLGNVLAIELPPVMLDTAHLAIHIERINAAVAADPALAIGSTKELVESTLKTILLGMGVSFDDKKDDVPALLKKAQKTLDLVPSEVVEAKRGAEIIRKVLSNLGAIVIGVAELRNLYGTGHGKAGSSRGLTVRHSRLVAGAGAALCGFLLETYEHRCAASSKKLQKAAVRGSRNVSV